MKTILIITGGYFVLGALLLLRIKSNKREKWVKYTAYLLIVAFVLGVYAMGYALWLNAGLSVIGLFEIITLYKNSQKINAFMLALFVYGGLAFSLLYISVNFSFLVLMMFYCLVFTFDGFSQLGGQLMGKHKLAQYISPNKTIEGLLIGCLTTAITACLLMPKNLAWAVTFGLFVSLCALFGDLAASWYKRKCGVKDFSQLIPGHGGVLDRFDSLFGAAPAIVLWYFVVHTNA